MSTASHKAHRISFSLLLKRHYLKVLIIGTLSFALAAPFIYFGAKPVYSAVVELRVDPSSASVVPGMENSLGMFYSEYVATQKFKILKSSNVEKAIAKLTPEQLAGVLGGASLTPKLTESLISAIQVEQSRDSLILSVSMSASNPEGLAEFLNNLIGIYMDELQSEKDSQGTSRINFSDQQTADLEAKIGAITAQLKQISEEISTGNFNSDDIPFKIEMKIQEETAIKAENDRLLKEKKYNDFLKNMYKGSASGSDVLVEARIASDPLLVDQKRQLLAKSDALNTQLNNLSAQNAGRKELEDGIAKINAQIADLEAKAREKYRKLVDNEALSAQDKQKAALYSDYIIAKEYEDGVKKSYKEAQDKYSFISKKVLVAQGLQTDLIDLKSQLAKVNETRTMLVGDQKSSGLVRVENYARPPVSPDKSSVVKTLIVAFVGSFAWIFALVVLLEFLDQRIKSAAELKSFTGIKPSWPISHYEGSILNVSLEDRDSVVFKAIQSLATRINQERQNFQVKVVTFTGVSHQCGTTDILLNCAHAMTDNCEKILVIDFNVSRPGIAAKLGIPLKSQPAVKNLDSAPLESVVYGDLARGVDVLTIRNLDKLENKVVDRVLELAKERYDLVLIDSAPILSSSSTEHLFLQSDAGVFVVRGNLSTFPDLQHTIELAGKFGIDSAALVLNWWKLGPKSSRNVAADFSQP